MSDLTLNKIFGAVLATGLAIVGLRELSIGVFEPSKPTKAGYAVEVAEEAGGGGGEAELPPDWGTLLPTADVAAGEAAFAKCKSCHVADASNANGTGPGLHAVVGRKPASHAGFAYSPAMTAYAGAHPVWTYDELDAFLKAPQKHIQGTKMTFVGLKKQEERVAVIAYLRAQGGTLPIPAPDPTRQPGAAAAAAPAAADAAAPAAAGEPTGVTAAPATQGAAGQGPGAAPVQKGATAGAPTTAGADSQPKR
ncbi:MAG: cytochrome c family protein [Phenylobacterium sp.]|uniref:c-type cytochrome n=1 Tax=Phenylobacterium sp. TaxID=1871053 RepID=UPI001A49B75B|nr:cytochrome c family protein [Phenylobacterium sp.]MBL8773521.1 cytochrome c family protein [Phenylobacterium sp.]